MPIEHRELVSIAIRKFADTVEASAKRGKRRGVCTITSKNLLDGKPVEIRERHKLDGIRRTLAAFYRSDGLAIGSNERGYSCLREPKPLAGVTQAGANR